MLYLYGFIIDELIYLELVEVAHRSPHWRREFDDLCDVYEPDAFFVIKEGQGVPLVKENLDELSDETYDRLQNLVGYVGLEGLTPEVVDDLIGTGDYLDLEDYEGVETEEEEELAEEDEE